MKKLGYIALFLAAMACSKDDSPRDALTPEAAFLGEVDWIRNFGGSGEDSAQAITATSDGGVAILGHTNSTDGDIHDKTTAVTDYWLLKLDAEGNLEWNKTYGGSGEDLGQNVIQTSDNGYALIGYSMSSDGDASHNEGFHDNWILKLDADGNIQWEKSFGFSGHDHAYDVLQTVDGGFFFVGFLDITASGGQGNSGKGYSQTRHGVGEFWGTKLDAQGNLEWRRYFGGTNNDRAYGVVQSNDGGYVMAGFSESDDFDVSHTKGSYDFWVVKINRQGNLVWERSFGGTGIEISYDIAKTADNAYVVTGHTFSEDTDISKNHGESDIWLIKIDDKGNLLWEKTYGGSRFDAAQSVTLAQDGGFIIAGNSRSKDMDATYNAGENDIWILKTDSQGTLLWQKSIGGTGFDYGFGALETANRDIILVGETQSTDFPNLQSRGKSDAVVIKIK